MLPGPGNYMTDGINTTNKYSFGKSQRAVPSSNTPAPGSYSTDMRVGKEGAKFSMGNKPELARTSNLDAPGPGAYRSNNLHLKTSTGVKVGTEARGPNYANGSPEPGKYDPVHDSSKPVARQTKLGGAQRFSGAQERVAKATPGPGDHNIKSAFELKPRFHMG